jgi:molybdate transport system substrate-binding protein
MRLIGWIFALAGVFVSAGLPAEEPVRIFAAASLTNALDDISMHWARSGHAAPKLSYGATSTLARQIEAGAPADLFAAADLIWMTIWKGAAKSSVERACPYLETSLC